MALSSFTSRSARARSSCAPFVSSRPRIMFSATVSVGTSMKCWCTIPTPAAIASAVDQPVTSRPFTSMRPRSGVYIPLSTRMSVDLPAPFSPTSAWISPRATSSDAPRLARTGPNDLSMSARRMASAFASVIASTAPESCPAMMSALICSSARAHGVGDERAIVLVVHVADAVLRQTEGVDAALERVVLHAADHLEHRDVDAFHHRREHAPRRFVVLVGVDADGVLARLPRRLEHAEPCRAGRVVDDVHALLVLVERELLALARIAERSGVTPAYCATTVQSGRRTSRRPCSPLRTFE